MLYLHTNPRPSLPCSQMMQSSVSQWCFQLRTYTWSHQIGTCNTYWFSLQDYCDISVNLILLRIFWGFCLNLILLSTWVTQPSSPSNIVTAGVRCPSLLTLPARARRFTPSTRATVSHKAGAKCRSQKKTDTSDSQTGSFHLMKPD